MSLLVQKVTSLNGMSVTDISTPKDDLNEGHCWSRSRYRIMWYSAEGPYFLMKWRVMARSWSSRNWRAMRAYLSCRLGGSGLGRSFRIRWSMETGVGDGPQGSVGVFQ